MDALPSQGRLGCGPSRRVFGTRRREGRLRVPRRWLRASAGGILTEMGGPDGSVPHKRGGPRDAVALTWNAKTTADVRGGLPRVFARGHLGRRPPGVFARGRMSRAHMQDLEYYGNVSCARAEPGVFAGLEQHVGLLCEVAGSRSDALKKQHRWNGHSLFIRVVVQPVGVGLLRGCRVAPGEPCGPKLPRLQVQGEPKQCSRKAPGFGSGSRWIMWTGPTREEMLGKVDREHVDARGRAFGPGRRRGCA